MIETDSQTYRHTEILRNVQRERERERERRERERKRKRERERDDLNKS